jgi:hypothetical protein
MREKRGDHKKINEIQGIIIDYIENIYLDKLENLEEMYKFLDTWEQQKLNQKNANHPNRSIVSNEIEAGIESPNKGNSGT